MPSPALAQLSETNHHNRSRRLYLRHECANQQAACRPEGQLSNCIRSHPPSHRPSQPPACRGPCPLLGRITARFHTTDTRIGCAAHRDGHDYHKQRLSRPWRSRGRFLHDCISPAMPASPLYPPTLAFPLPLNNGKPHDNSTRRRRRRRPGGEYARAANHTPTHMRRTQLTSGLHPTPAV